MKRSRKAIRALVLAFSLGLAGCSGGGNNTAAGIMLFAASDGVSGVELWKSDGTEAGTVLVIAAAYLLMRWSRLLTEYINRSEAGRGVSVDNNKTLKPN